MKPFSVVKFLNSESLKAHPGTTPAKMLLEEDPGLLRKNIKEILNVLHRFLATITVPFPPSQDLDQMVFEVNRFLGRR